MHGKHTASRLISTGLTLKTVSLSGHTRLLRVLAYAADGAACLSGGALELARLALCTVGLGNHPNPSLILPRSAQGTVVERDHSISRLIGSDATNRAISARYHAGPCLVRSSDARTAVGQANHPEATLKLPCWTRYALRFSGASG